MSANGDAAVCCPRHRGKVIIARSTEREIPELVAICIEPEDPIIVRAVPRVGLGALTAFSCSPGKDETAIRQQIETGELAPGVPAE